MTSHTVWQGSAKNFIRRAKVSKKKVKIRVLKSMKKVQTQTLESGFSNEGKITLISSQAYIYLLWPKNKTSVLLQAWERHCKGKGGKFGEFG